MRLSMKSDLANLGNRNLVGYGIIGAQRLYHSAGRLLWIKIFRKITRRNVIVALIGVFMLISRQFKEHCLSMFVFLLPTQWFILGRIWTAEIAWWFGCYHLVLFSRGPFAVFFFDYWFGIWIWYLSKKCRESKHYCRNNGSWRSYRAACGCD